MIAEVQSGISPRIFPSFRFWPAVAVVDCGSIYYITNLQWLDRKFNVMAGKSQWKQTPSFPPPWPININTAEDIQIEGKGWKVGRLTITMDDSGAINSRVSIYRKGWRWGMDSTHDKKRKNSRRNLERKFDSFTSSTILLYHYYYCTTLPDR